MKKFHISFLYTFRKYAPLVKIFPAKGIVKSTAKITLRNGDMANGLDLANEQLYMKLL